MSLNNPIAGNGSAWEYVVSGWPWVTASLATSGSAININFPMVTSFLEVRVTGSNVRVGFTKSGSQGGNYVTVTSTSPWKGTIKTKQIWVIAAGAATSSFEVVAGLTAIDKRNFPFFSSSAAPTSVTGSTATYGFIGYTDNTNGQPGGLG